MMILFTTLLYRALRTRDVAVLFLSPSGVLFDRGVLIQQQQPRAGGDGADGDYSVVV